MQHSATPSRRNAADLLLWYAVLAPPVVWSGHLLTSYLLVSTACDAGQTSMRAIIAATTALAEALIIAAGVAGYAYWRPRADADGRDDDRPSFMGYLGVLESMLFVVATLFTAAPVFVLRLCS